jgi:hypothetical protein
MTKDQYRELLPLVNDYEQYGRLRTYAVQRMEVLRTQLETQKDPTRIYEIQGAIAELRRFSTLRDEVISNSKQ